jgi:uncharacterized protein (DUF2252 family)
MLQPLRTSVIVLLFATAVSGGQRAFDVIQRAYSPYMSMDDPFAFPMKVKSLTADPYKFWRGSKDLFLRWCGTNAADWLQDREVAVNSHGDLHLGNIGAYATGWQKLAFGVVDLDDATELPFQIELLQGVITLELVADRNRIDLDHERRAQLVRSMIAAYSEAMQSDRSPTESLGNDAIVQKMLDRASRDYAEELKRYTESGRFRNRIGPKKNPKELLRPAIDRKDDIAAALAHAVEQSPELCAVLRYRTPAEFRNAIRDVAMRSRLGSSGSQGLKKYLVLMDKPLVGVESDAILYLKQEIPTAAQRSGLVEQDTSETPGKRIDRLMRAMLSPPPYLSGSCEIGEESYWVSLKEPWSDELDPAKVDSVEELLHLAQIWGTVAGAAHNVGGSNIAAEISKRLGSGLIEPLLARSGRFREELERDFEGFGDDPRVKKHVAAADGAFQTGLKK